MREKGVEQHSLAKAMKRKTMTKTKTMRRAVIWKTMVMEMMKRKRMKGMRR